MLKNPILIVISFLAFLITLQIIAVIVTAMAAIIPLIALGLTIIITIVLGYRFWMDHRERTIAQNHQREMNALELEATKIKLQAELLDLDIVTVPAFDMPISREIIASGQHIQQQFLLASQYIDAQRRPQTPELKTFSYQTTQTALPEQMQAPPEQVQAIEPFTPPTFAEMLEDGRLGHGEFLLGFTDAGEAVYEGWKSIYSAAIAGLTGTGKSTTTRNMVAQAVLNGCGVVIIDPHAGAGEDSLADSLQPLAGSFLVKPASKDGEILSTLEYVHGVGQRRVHGEDKSKSPILVVIDEATRLMNRSSIGDDVAAILEAIAQEYRKVGIYAMILGQIWTASRTGGTSALRDSLASVLCHRMKRKQANMLLPAGEGATAETLRTGQVFFAKTSGESVIFTSLNCQNSDIESVAQIVDLPLVESGSNSGYEGGYGGSYEIVTVEPVAHPTPHTVNTEKVGGVLSVKALKVAQAKREKWSTNRIVKEIFGVEGKGRAYQNALAELADIEAEIYNRLV